MSLSLFLSIGILHGLALMSPGPDFALIVRHSHQRRAAIGAAFGIALGILLHSILSLTGVSLLIQNHPLLFTLVRASGASYLLWLGLGALWSCRRPAAGVGTATQQPTVTVGRALRDGLATNLLNPKALAFFIGLLAALVTPAVPLWARGMLVLELFLLTLCWFVPLAWLLSSPRIRNRLARAERGITCVTGLLFTSVGGFLWLEMLFG